MAITRRRLLGQGGAALGAAAALQVSGIYRALDGVARNPDRGVAEAATQFPPEQHLLQDVPIITQDGIAVLVPPLHHQVLTARLTLPATARALTDAQATLENALRRIEALYPPTPAGLGIVVGWGLPYFTTAVPAPWQAHLPIDNRATAAAGRTTGALLDAERFPSDPAEMLLEQNEIVVRLVSDALDHIESASAILALETAGMFALTSVRKGFVGGGFDGRTSLPKKMATLAGIPGAQYIPDTAELFMGFTSTQNLALGPNQIANLESLPGLTNQWGGYFQHGTVMHLSHLYEDLEQWYTRFSFDQRVEHTFRPGLKLPSGAQLTPEGPGQAETLANVVSDATTTGMVGHSGSLQPQSRLAAAVTDNYGTVYPAGTAIPQRGDFNTLDNPFFWTATPDRDGQASGYAAGLHFVVFAPTSDAFARTRKAMDGRYSDTNQTTLPLPPDSRAMGFNKVLRTTHRQYFLVPPRAHRSFPLAELL